MDVGYFISELLGRHGEVSVPGLGFFAHTRVNGYYNDADGKFYPPGYSIQFDPQFTDDDTLAQYIADSKNISLASSKYFTEKYVANLKQIAATGEATMADVGWFHSELGRLIFKSNNNLNTDPEFFGHPAVTLNKLSTEQPNDIQPVYSTETEAAHEPVPDVDIEQFETDEGHEAYLVELTVKRRKKSFWTFLILALLFTALIVYLVNKYDRSVFDLGKKPARDTAARVNPNVKKPKTVLVVDSAHAGGDDTIFVAKRGGKVDSIAIAPKIDTATITGPRFEILGGSFSTVQQANVAIGNYKRLGFKAHILQNVPGRKRKVTLGTFKTRSEAIEAQKKLINTGKISSANVYIQPYKK